MPYHGGSRPEDWPSLPVAAWDETRATLDMWTQIIGKIRLAQAPMFNHRWQVPLYVTSRGLTTAPIPDGARTFQIDPGFIASEDQREKVLTGGGGKAYKRGPFETGASWGCVD